MGQAPNASVDDANAAAAAAKEAFPAWAATPVEERLALLKQAAAAIRAKDDELVPLVIAETGATASVGSRMQVPVSAATGSTATRGTSATSRSRCCRRLSPRRLRWRPVG